MLNGLVKNLKVAVVRANGRARARGLEDQIRQAAAIVTTTMNQATAAMAQATATTNEVKAFRAQIKKMEDDVIITSTKGSDSDRGAVGPMLAELLGLPYIGLVSEIAASDGKFDCKRQVEGGITESFTVSTPAVICCEQGVRGQARYPSLMQIMKAKKKPLEEKTAADYGVDVRPRLEIVKTSEPEARKAGQIVGSVDELVAKLKEAGAV